MKDKKNLFYGQLWPHGIGCDTFISYAFDTNEEREKWLRQYLPDDEEGNPIVCIADFEDMQNAYGTDFCVLGGAFDGEVCSRQAAIELHQISATRYC